MKNKILKLIFMSTIAFMIVQCESHEQKADTAFESYKNDKTSIDILTTMISETESLNNPSKKKLDTLSNFIKDAINQPISNEWFLYKIDCEKKIRENERQIKIIYKHLKNDEKAIKKLSDLERENNDIKKEIVEYEEEMKLSLAGFKSKINKATFDIKNELSEISIKK